MIRRLIWSTALFACAGIYVFAAAARATFILTDGERKSGIVVFHGGQNENLINGHLNLGVDNGKDITFPIEQVAVIDFVGGLRDMRLRDVRTIGDPEIRMREDPIRILMSGSGPRGTGCPGHRSCAPPALPGRPCCRRSRCR